MSIFLPRARTAVLVVPSILAPCTEILLLAGIPCLLAPNQPSTCCCVAWPLLACLLLGFLQAGLKLPSQGLSGSRHSHAEMVTGSIWAGEPVFSSDLQARNPGKPSSSLLQLVHMKQKGSMSLPERGRRILGFRRAGAVLCSATDFLCGLWQVASSQCSWTLSVQGFLSAMPVSTSSTSLQALPGQHLKRWDLTMLA